jgi:hypothetical protein
VVQILKVVKRIKEERKGKMSINLGNVHIQGLEDEEK